MKTSADLEALVTDIVRGRMTGVIAGEVYNDDRPVNSMKEDITVKVLTGRHAQRQLTIVNINIYTPDIKKGVYDVKNTERLDYLKKIMLELFKNYHKNACKIKTESDNDYEAVDLRQHYSNVKVLIENINFK